MDMQTEISFRLGVNSKIDPEQEVRRRVDFLKGVLAGVAKGFVLGISGGVDSTLAGKLAQMAVEELTEETGVIYDFWALRLPYGDQRDEEDAQKALDFIQSDHRFTINIKPAVDASVKGFEMETGIALKDFVKGNIKARERMIAQYTFANMYGLLVLGTNNASEEVMGYYTKHGDGACDVEVLSGLTKRQIRQMLQVLGAPEELVDKVPTADLLDESPGQADEVELGLRYDEIDDYLEGKEVSERVRTAIEERYHASIHKRVEPIRAGLSL